MLLMRFCTQDDGEPFLFPFPVERTNMLFELSYVVRHDSFLGKVIYAIWWSVSVNVKSAGLAVTERFAQSYHLYASVWLATRCK
jgi:hypothetical protein